jgi:hypothetical protein
VKQNRSSKKLAEDLKAEFPGMTGFSPRNVWRMRAFYLAYTDEVRNLQSDLAKETLKNPDSFEFLTIADDAAEQELERGLVAHIRKFFDRARCRLRLPKRHSSSAASAEWMP